MTWNGVVPFGKGVAACIALLAALSAIAQAPDPQSAVQPPLLSADAIVKNLQMKNQERAQALHEFQSTRVYRMEYRGLPSNRDAELVVKLRYRSPDKKEFSVVSQSGSKFIVDHVLKKLLESEQEAANEENKRNAALSPENYDFQMAAYESSASGERYVLQVIPKSKNKFLYRGKIWIDAKDFAVTQIEAEPAKNPSFWIKKTDIEHKYVKINDFWFPAENRTVSLIRLGGRATLTIEYKDYRVTDAGPLNPNQKVDQNSAVAQLPAEAN
jgi:outer membrane lipoprotein-sorting protein